MYRIIEIDNLDNPSQYKWFRTFANPCYGMNVKTDVTQVVKVSKATGTSFFANVLYLVTKAFNSVDEMRMREVRGQIRLYDVINPTFTVMTDSGRFANAGFKMIEDYRGFYDKTRQIIEEKKSQTAFGDGYNDLSMIRFAGMGVAMDNAAPELRAVANYITLSNEQDGVAAALEHFEAAD